LLLAWAVRGASRLIQQRSFTIPPSSETALRLWIHSTDPVLAWVHARVDAALPGTSQKIQGIKSSEAHSMFRKWALQEGFLENTIPAVSGFVQRLQASKLVPGIIIKHGRQGNWLTGLTIRTNDRDAADDEDDSP